MAIIKPFKGIRPAPDKVHLVASRPVETYDPSLLQAKLRENPYTFLHVIKPEFDINKKSKPGSLDLLKKIKSKFEKFRENKYFIQDKKEVLYIYSQEHNGITNTGIIGCAGVQDYLDGTIKIHEQTLSNKEETLKNYLEVCDFNAEPVCLTYPADKKIDKIVERFTKKEKPIYDFTTTNQKRHKLWVIDSKSKVKRIVEQFEKIPALYIADGHHRSASSTLLAKAKRQEMKKFSGEEPFNFFMSIYFPEHELEIYDYNRVVTDFGDLSLTEFLNKLKTSFEVELLDTDLFKPTKFHEFSLYTDGKWYKLTSKPGTFDEKDPVSSLDADILSENLFGPILGINDLRTDKRIGFISGILGPKEIKSRVDSGKMKAGFGLFPVTMEQLKAVADAGKSMPPKSTWIEPKLRNGLTVYSLSE
jgi:uncharacterized protein (DUF1015 family)